MPHVGTVAPSYASCTSELRSMAFEMAQRTEGLSSGGCAFCTISARGHGSSQAYGGLLVQAETFGLRWATFRNEPRPRMPILGVSRSLFDSARAAVVSLP